MDFTTVDGHLQYTLPNGLYYALAPAEWWYFGPLIAGLIPFGVWAALGTRNAAMRMLVVWAALVLLFHAGAPWQNPRFALAYLPPVAIMAALGFATLSSARGARFRAGAAAYLMLGLVVSTGGSLVLTSRFIDRKQDDLATVQWVAAQAPPHVQLLTFGLTATFERYSDLETRDLSELSPAMLEPLVTDGRPTLVLLDLNGVERQWQGFPPWENYRWLREGPGLAPLGVHGPYSLLAVNPNVT
jgi:hypothetical protein